MKKLRVCTAFSGYDSQCMALDRLGIDYELVGWSEIDKYAIQAHNAVYPQWKERNFGDISKIDWNLVPDFDMFTYSFPCTDISVAGLQKGLKEGSGTRSSLLWECKKAIELKKPKYLLMENVKALTSKKFLPYLKEWDSYLRMKGYTNFTKVLNAKDYGVPQNRERVFMVSILGEAMFHFPLTIRLVKRLKDVLETNVDEKYYLSDKKIESFIRNNEKHRKKENGFLWKPKTGNNIANCIRANVYKTGATDNTVLIVGRINASQDGKVHDTNGIVQCISAGHNNSPKILQPIICAMRGRNPENPSDRKCGSPTEQRIEVGGDVSNTITTVQKDNLVIEPIFLEEIGNKRLKEMLESGQIASDKAQIIDVYNRSISEDLCPTIRTNIDSSCNYWVSEPLYIAQATEKGYAEIYPGGVFDASFPGSNTRRGRVQECGEISPTILANQQPPCRYEGIKVIANINNVMSGRIYDVEAISPCLTASQGGNVQPKIIDNVEFICNVNPSGKGMNGNVFGIDGVSPTLTTNKGEGVKIVEYGITYRIRKLTPRECLRLMDVPEKYIDKMLNSGISNSQLYKMAGNSIVVACLEHIFRKMFIDKENEAQQLSLF